MQCLCNICYTTCVWSCVNISLRVSSECDIYFFQYTPGLETPDMQLSVLKLIMDELPSVNKLLLSWLFVHMNHIADKVCLDELLIFLIILFIGRCEQDGYL